MTTGYQLEIQIPKQDTQEVLVEKRLTIGESEECDLCLEGLGLSPKHAQFNLQNGVLVVLNLGGKNAVKVGRQKLEQGKSYILDDQDKITMGKLTIVVHEVELDYEADQTSPSSLLRDPNKTQTSSLSVPQQTEPSLDVGVKVDELHDDNDDEEEDEGESVEYTRESTSIDVGFLLSGRDQHDPEAQNAPDKKKKKNKDSSILIKLTRTVTGFFKRKSKADWDAAQEKKRQKEENPDLVEEEEEKPEKERQPVLGNMSPPPNLTPKKRQKTAGASRDIPGVIARVFALTLQLSMVWLITQIIQVMEIDLSSIQELYTKTMALAHESLPKIAQHLPESLTLPEDLLPFFPFPVFLFCLTFMALDLATAVIFGVNISLWMLGVRETSGLIKSRIKALIRHPLGWITGPLLIFDLGVLGRRRSFKEWLTRSMLEKRSPLTAFLSFLLFIPTLAFALILQPLVFYTGDFYQFSQLKIPMHDEEFEPLHYYRLKSYELDIPWTQERDAMSSLTPVSIGSESLFGIETWVERDGPSLAIVPGPRFDLKHWLDYYFSKNHLARFIQKDLLAFTDNPEALELTPELEREVVDMIRFTFSPNFTDPLELQEALSKYGPLLISFLQLKNLIVNEFKIQPGDRLEYWNFVNKSWLVIHKTLSETEYEVVVLPMNKIPSRSFRVATKNMPYQDLVQYTATQMIDFHPFKQAEPEPFEVEKDQSYLWLIPNLVDALNHRFVPEINFPYSQEQLNTLFKRLTYRIHRQLEIGEQSDLGRNFDRQLELLHTTLKKDEEKLSPKFRPFVKEFFELYRAYQVKDLSNYPIEL